MKYKDKILEPLTVEKNNFSKNNIKTKSFGFTVLGFGSGGAAPTPFIQAEGGTITTSGDFKIHTFTGDGTFNVINAGDPSTSNSIEHIIVAGGAGGGRYISGGGGAGGLRDNFPSPATGGTPVSVQGYP